MSDAVPPQPNKAIGCGVPAILLGLVFSCVAGAFIITPQARQNIITATYVIAGLTTVTAFALATWYAVEHVLTTRATRKQVQSQAEFNVYETQNGDLHIRELNKHVDWRAASRDPRVYANGRWVPPTPEEVAAFSQWMTVQTRSTGQARLISAQASLPAPHPIDLLDVLRRTRKVLVVGPEGAGKTSLLHAIIRQRLSASLVVVFDPHGNAADWPAGCEVVGPGRRYDLIEQRFRDIEHELDKRYKLVAQDTAHRSRFQPITLVIDEWSQLVDRVDNGATFIKMILTESRKVNMAAFVAGHSERVELLGLKGSGDLKKGFATVRLFYDQVSHRRRQSIDYGDDIGERDAAFTPTEGGIATPHLTGNFSATSKEKSDILPAAPPSRKALEDAEFIRLVQEEGLSRRQASLEAYGKPYSGEKLVNRARSALGEI